MVGQATWPHDADGREIRLGDFVRSGAHGGRPTPVIRMEASLRRDGSVRWELEDDRGIIWRDPARLRLAADVRQEDGE